LAPEAGIEPATNRLTADRSTAELLRSVACRAQLLLPLGDREARARELQMVAPGFVALNADLCSVGSECGFGFFVGYSGSGALGLFAQSEWSGTGLWL
jgi:hypothetical protein